MKTSSTSSSALFTAAAAAVVVLGPLLAVVIDAQSVADAIANESDPTSTEQAEQAAATASSSSNGTTTNVTYEDLATLSLSLDQYNSIRASESPNDFGGLASSDDTERLWLDAARFEHEVAMSYASDIAPTSPGYHPYLVCSTYPDLSGKQREDQITYMFGNTSGVSPSDYYTYGNLFLNNNSMSCGVIRAYDDTVAKVMEGNPGVGEWMSVNPLHPSMKMAANTVEVMEKWFVDQVSGDVISISGDENGDGADGDNTITANVLGFHLTLCPGVKVFDGQVVPDEQIGNDIRDFVTKDGGKNVADLSFYHQRVTGAHGNDTVHTFRMAQWSGAISNVTSWTDPATGSNGCLDAVITDNMVFDVDGTNLEVYSKLSFVEGDSWAVSLGYKEEMVDVCVWYMTYALALSPMVCSLEPKTKIKVLCKDGTTDLTKCGSSDAGGDGDAESVDGDDGSGGEGDGGSGSSGGSIVGANTWRNIVARAMALFVGSSLAGAAVL